MVTKTKLPASIKQPWHAVSVVGGPRACPATEGLRHKRFLSDEAPRLPLPECSSPWCCKCTYGHYSIDARIPAGRGIAVGSQALRLAQRGARGFRRADGGQTIRLVHNNGARALQQRSSA